MSINNQKTSSKRGSIADSKVLDEYNAVPIIIVEDGEADTTTDVTSSSTSTSTTSTSTSATTCNGIVTGINISNWDIKTSSSTIGHEGEMDALTMQVQDLANNVNDKVNDKDHENEYDKKPRRRLCIPEIVFLDAFVHLQLRINKDVNKEDEDEDEDDGNNKDVNEEEEEQMIVDIKLNANDALGEWAACHSRLSLEESQGQSQSQGQGQEHDKNDNYRGVSVIKSIDAKLWSERHQLQKKQQREQNNASTGRGKVTSSTSTEGCFGQNAISATTEFNYDWTFSTPYTGTYTTFIQSRPQHETQTQNQYQYQYQNQPKIKQNMEWKPSPSSLIDVSLLMDQSQPILYFDDINLYEDDMHDNGYVSLKCKIRVMPTCFFILMSLFVRVDHVLIRVKEVRTFCKFPSSEVNRNANGNVNDNRGEEGKGREDKEDKYKYRICRDVTWKECKWDQLNKLSLPSFVGSWRIEDENGGQAIATQQRIQGLLRRLPLIDLPSDIHKHSYVDIL